MNITNITNYLTNVKGKRDDDAVDRINYRVTPIIFGIFALILGGKLYFGRPVQCWVPAQFKEGWEKYAENYCYIDHTYYVPFDEVFPRTTSERKERALTYYKWLPIFLAIQGCLFCLPKILWDLFKLKTGMHINSMVDMAMNQAKKSKNMDRKSKTRHADAAAQLERVIDYHLKSGQCKNIPPKQNYVTNLYLLFKALHMVICLAQLVVLNIFVTPDSHSLWGWGILKDIYNDQEWQYPGHFPIVSYCDISIREQGGNLVPHTFQCQLPINVLAEKFYVIVWFWLSGLSLINVLNLSIWFIRCNNPSNMRKFVSNHIIVDIPRLELDGKFSNADVDEFVQQRLCRDGLTAIRLIYLNCGHMSTSSVLTPLFMKFLDDCRSGKVISYNQKPTAKQQREYQDDENGPKNKDTWHPQAKGIGMRTKSAGHSRQTQYGQPGRAMDGSNSPYPHLPPAQSSSFPSPTPGQKHAKRTTKGGPSTRNKWNVDAFFWAGGAEDNNLAKKS